MLCSPKSLQNTTGAGSLCCFIQPHALAAMWWCLKPIAKGLRDLAQFMDPVVPGPTPACPCCYYNYMKPIGDPADLNFTAGWYELGDQWHWWHGNAIHGRPGCFRDPAALAGPWTIGPDTPPVPAGPPTMEPADPGPEEHAGSDDWQHLKQSEFSYFAAPEEP